MNLIESLTLEDIYWIEKPACNLLGDFKSFSEIKTENVKWYPLHFNTSKYKGIEGKYDFLYIKLGETSYTLNNAIIAADRTNDPRKTSDYQHRPLYNYIVLFDSIEINGINKTEMTLCHD